MKKEELEEIIKEQQNLTNLPNAKLITYMDLISEDFEVTKNNIIAGTVYLDKLELLYNNILNVFNQRGDGR